MRHAHTSAQKQQGREWQRAKAKRRNIYYAGEQRYCAYAVTRL
jgi:hypothetical protein